MTAVVLVVAALWLLTLLLAAMLPGKKTKGLRSIDLFVVIFTLAFGATWVVTLLHTARPAQKKAETVAAAGTAASCASIKVGDSEKSVRTALGEPTDARAEEEVRGPGAGVWIYRDSRCAVHHISGSVVFVE